MSLNVNVNLRRHGLSFSELEHITQSVSMDHNKSTTCNSRALSNSDPPPSIIGDSRFPPIIGGKKNNFDIFQERSWN